MKKLFTAIRKNDIATVGAILEKSPESISCVSTGAPKKDIGQSPLQVALKASSTEIIHCLLDRHADVNFMEGEDTPSEWRAPVLHDAINRAVMCSRWNTVSPDGLSVYNTKKDADEAFEILKRMISLGADVNGKDSFGNACLDRACLQARQILPDARGGRVLTEELREDLARIFDLLTESGADLSYIRPGATGKNYAEQYADDPLGMFLK